MIRRVYHYENDNIKNRQITARYGFSSQLVRGKFVADIGCGARSGPRLLAETANAVAAVDISHEAIAYSAKMWPRRNLFYLAADASQLPFKDSCLDCVLSLEVIEHLHDHQNYLAEINRVLKQGGVAVISTPNKPVTSHGTVLSNPDHIREFDLEEFQAALGSYFPSFTVYGQKPSPRVIQAERCLGQINQQLERVPGIFRRLLPGPLKRVMRTVFSALFAWAAALPDPNQVTEEDFIFQEKDADTARNFLAVCRKQ